MYPYQTQVKAGEAFPVCAEVKNPGEDKVLVKVRFVLPKGFTGRTYFEKEANALETIRITADITAPGEALRRARIGCDITLDERKYGQQAELLVTVLP